MEEVRDDNNLLVSSFFEFAHRFDKMSQTVLDTYMCTSTCPCLDYTANAQNSLIKYQQNSKIIVEDHGRTFDDFDRTRLFMNFTTNKDIGFKSFDECYAHWTKKVNESKGSLSIEQVFKIEIEDLVAHLPEIKEIIGDHHIKEDSRYILSHFKEIEMYQALEDEYQCSGMCKTSLFFFGKELN